jgi:hypothetical protein
VKRTEIFLILTINYCDSVDVARHDRMVELVQSMLDLHELASTGTDHDKGAARSPDRGHRSADRPGPGFMG